MKHTSLSVACILLCACSAAAVRPATSLDGGDSPAAPAGDGVGVVAASDGGGDDGGAVTAGGDDGGAPTAVDADAGTGGDDGSVATSDAAPSPGGDFGDAGPYVPTLGPSSRNPKHAGNPNPAGQACLSCHGGQRPNVVRFLFAGTVWSSAAATTPTPMAEVRVVEANGAGLSAYSDADGNFYFLESVSGPLVPPAHGAVRDAKSSIAMTNVFNDGDCNSCHRVGGEAPVNLP